MKSGLRLSFCRGDVLAILLVAVLALGVFSAFALGLAPAQDAVLQIYQDGRLLRELPLDADAEFELSGEYTNTVSLRDGRAAITASDCPGQDCMHSGWIDSAGRSIVCLPNAVEIRIVADEADVDFVVR